MDYKIAVLVDSLGETVAFDMPGKVRVYCLSNNCWSVEEEIHFFLDTSMNLLSLRVELDGLVNKLNGCKIIVAKQVLGVVFTMLDRYGFHIWEFPGKPEHFLDLVFDKEKKACEDLKTNEKIKLIEHPFEDLGDGRYAINVKDILFRNGETTSKKILKPFFETINFYELKVTFAHIPPWLDLELIKYGLKKSIDHERNEEITLLIHRVT